MQFDLFINDEKKFTFNCPKTEAEKNWIIRQGTEELAFVASGQTDEKGTIFGYQFLTVSRRDFPKGSKLKLKIAAENVYLPDVYVAYQNTVETVMQVFALQAVKRIDGALKQPVLVEFTHIGAPVTATLMLDGKKQQDCDIHLGLNKFTIWVDKVAKPRQAALKLILNNQNKANWNKTVTLEPVHPFEVYFLPHSHVDIGFTHLQAEVEKLQWRNFEQGIELAKKTADYPDGSRYKWNVEVLWAVDGYLKNASPETRAAFYDAVKKGWIGLDALYGSELTGLQRPEELMHVTAFANELEREQGIHIQSAMITDVPGYAWESYPRWRKTRSNISLSDPITCRIRRTAVTRLGTPSKPGATYRFTGKRLPVKIKYYSG